MHELLVCAEPMNPDIVFVALGIFIGWALTKLLGLLDEEGT
jgi:hypothetical protein